MAKVLIINADDLGYDPAITRGIITSMKHGVVTSTTLLVNTPSAASAVAQSAGLAVGLHFNLARFRPVSTNFPPRLLRNGELAEALVAQLPTEVVRAELIAQLSRFESMLKRPPTHIDVHKHLHKNPNVLEGMIELAAERHLPVRAVDPAMRAQLRRRGIRTNDALLGEDSSDAYWTKQRFSEAVASLSEGVTELMCHPGYRPETIRTSYGAQREIELETMVDGASRQLLRTANIELTTY